MGNAVWSACRVLHFKLVVLRSCWFFFFLIIIIVSRMETWPAYKDLRN